MGMKKRTGLTGILYLAILSAIAGYFFRMTYLNGGSAIPLIAFSVLMLLVFALAAVSLEKEAAYAALFRPANEDLIFSLLGAAALMVGCAMEFSGSMMRMLLAMLGILAGGGLAAAAVLRRRGKMPPAALYVFAIVFYVARLFRDFRRWMHDPAVLGYCFHLFALISFMLAAYHAGAFSFDRGARRRFAFFSLTGVLFGAVALCGSDWPTALVYGGSALWTLACAQQAMRRAH